MNRAVTITLPDGYKDAEEFAKDCGFDLIESKPLASQERLALIIGLLKRFHSEMALMTFPDDHEFYRWAAAIDTAINNRLNLIEEERAG